MSRGVSRLLDRLADPAVLAPRTTLTVLLVVTIGFGWLAGGLEVETDLDSFAPEGGVADTLDEVDERFTSDRSIQVFADAGPGGDVLDRQVLLAVEDIGDRLEADPEVAGALAEDAIDRPALVTFADPFLSAGDVLDVELDELDRGTFTAIVRGLLEDEEAGDQLASLLSTDLDVDAAQARAGLLQLELSAEVDDEDLIELTATIERIVAASDDAGLRWSVLSDAAIEEAIEDGLLDDLPVLLGISLLLVVGVLAWLFRSVSDVVVGFVGLLASMVWMAGLAALLGPSYLGVTGGFTQIAIAVPVLLVGLGVDYSVHLTSRYREQQARGDAPERAARVALRTVGIALILATAATVAGFLANLATPLPPIADFGIFAAAGIVSAFVLLGLGVPATRVLLDRRRADRDDRSDGGPGTGVAAPDRGGETGDGATSRWAIGATALATRVPGTVLLVTAGLLVVAGVAASGLDTEFDERDFLPEDGPLTALLDRIDAQFGGDVGERTAVLVAGDPADPELVEAVARFERDLVEVDDVRTIGDRAQVVSPFELIERLGLAGERAREQVADDLTGWVDPDTAVEDVPLPDRIDAELVEQAGGDGLDLRDDLRDALVPRLPADRDPVVALAVTSDPEELRATLRDELRAELEAGRPDGVDDATLRALADVPVAELTRDRLVEAGLDAEVVGADELEAIARLDALTAAGWEADAAPDGDALVAQIAVVADEAPDELGDVLDDDGLLLQVSTLAGPERAERLAADLQALAADVRAAGGEVTFASQALVAAEIIEELADAQLVAIAISLLAATVLLAGATWWSDRRVALGLIGIVPSVVGLAFVLGSMRALGLAFDALTATVASIAVGIGVPYGIHLTNRFREARAHGRGPEAAIGETLQHTGAALAGSAITTGLAFGVLVLSSSTPIQQFGLVSALMIGYALLACLVVQPSLLVVWARRRDRVGDRRDRRRAGRDRSDRSDRSDEQRPQRVG